MSIVVEGFVLSIGTPADDPAGIAVHDKSDVDEAYFGRAADDLTVCPDAYASRINS